MNSGDQETLKEFPYLACQSKDQRKPEVGAISQSWNRGQVFGLFLASNDIEYNRLRPRHKAVLKALACPQEIPGVELSCTMSHTVSSSERMPVNMVT